jgi:hypothetical protein
MVIILSNYQDDFLDRFSFSDRVVFYVLLPFLAYRSFKRCLTYTTSFSLHLSLLICLIAVNSGREGGGCLLALIMPPLPANPLLAMVSIFTIPPKAIHKNECCYQIAYFTLSLIGLALYILSLGTL